MSGTASGAAAEAGSAALEPEEAGTVTAGTAASVEAGVSGAGVFSGPTVMSADGLEPIEASTLASGWMAAEMSVAPPSAEAIIRMESSADRVETLDAGITAQANRAAVSRAVRDRAIASPAKACPRPTLGRSR
jgi:hypothetical protein